MDPLLLLLIVPTSVLVGVFGAYYANTYKGVEEVGQRVTPSCGCILCDLKLPVTHSDIGPYHQTQHGAASCTRL